MFFVYLMEFLYPWKKNMALFEEYKNHQDPFVWERASNWAVAIELQRVDKLNVSDFLIEIACQEIEGKITMVVLTSEISNLFEHFTTSAADLRTSCNG